MAEVKVTGHSIFRKELRLATGFFCNHLLGKRLSNNIIVNIHFVKNLLSNDGDRMLGECIPLYKYTRSRAFQVCLRSDLSRKQTILTLAHECVHLKQFARGELSSGLYPVMKFFGAFYTEEESDYRLTPYEVEATKNEQVLYYLWLNFKKENL
jgi:hypothetical protein